MTTDPTDLPSSDLDPKRQRRRALRMSVADLAVLLSDLLDDDEEDPLRPAIVDLLAAVHDFRRVASATGFGD